MKGTCISRARSYIHFASDQTGPKCLSLKTGTTRPYFLNVSVIASKKRRRGCRTCPLSFDG